VYIVVAYDVVDTPRRTRLAKRLKGYLERVQKSVFEGELEQEQLRAMEAQLGRLLDEDEDSLRVYALCSACRRRIKVYGQGEVLEDPDVYIV